MNKTIFFFQQKNLSKDRVLDYDLIFLWFVLLGIGLVMVYSATVATAEFNIHTGGDPTFYLFRQTIFICIGVFAAGFCLIIPTRYWQIFAPYLFMISIVLLALVLIPAVGKEVNGSSRWLSYGGLNLQPSELAKLSIALYASDYTVRKAGHMSSFRKGFLPMLVVMLGTGALLLEEPDFGAFLIVTIIAVGALFLGGMNWRLFGSLTFLLLLIFALLIVFSPYRMQRIMGFMDPFSDPYGKGYQLSHALMAFGRGEWFGVGLGGSVEKLEYLPDAHTDFLLAVIAEELGFIGVVVIIFLFLCFFWKAFSIGAQSARFNRNYSALVAQVIALWIGSQTLINMGVNMGLLPTKGLTLPFLSYGGSALVANCMAVGLLLRIDFENRQLVRGFKV